MDQNLSVSVTGEFLSDVKRCGVAWFNSKVRTLSDLVSYSSFVQAHGDSLITNVGVNFCDYVEDLQAFASFSHGDEWRVVDIQGYNVLVPVAGDPYLAGKYVQGELDGCSESYPLYKRGRNQCPVCLHLHELTRSCLVCHTKQGELGMVLVDVDVPVYVSESVGKSLIMMGHRNVSWGPDGLARWWLVMKVGLYVFLSSNVTREDRLAYFQSRVEGLAGIAASLVDNTTYPYGSRLSTSMMRDLVKREGTRIGPTLFYMKVMKKLESTGDVCFKTSFDCLSDRDASLGECVGQAEAVDLVAMTRTAAGFLLTGDDYHKAKLKWSSGVFMSDAFFLQFRNERCRPQLGALGVFVSRSGVVDLLDDVPMSAPPKVVRFRDLDVNLPKLSGSVVSAIDSYGSVGVVGDIDCTSPETYGDSGFEDDEMGRLLSEDFDESDDEFAICARIVSGGMKGAIDVALEDEATLVGDSVLSEDFSVSDVDVVYRPVEVEDVSDGSSVELHGGEGPSALMARELVLYDENVLPEELLALKVSTGDSLHSPVEVIRDSLIEWLCPGVERFTLRAGFVDKVERFVVSVCSRVLKDIAVRVKWGVNMRLSFEWFLGPSAMENAHRFCATLSCIVPKEYGKVANVGCIARSNYVASANVFVDFVAKLGILLEIPGKLVIDMPQEVDYMAQAVRVRSMDFVQYLANAEMAKNIGIPDVVNRLVAVGLMDSKTDYAVAVLSWWGIHCSVRKYAVLCDMVSDDVVLFSRISSFEVERAKHAVKLDYQSGLYTATCDGVELVGERASDVVKAHYGLVKVKKRDLNVDVYLSSVKESGKVQYAVG